MSEATDSAALAQGVGMPEGEAVPAQSPEQAVKPEGQQAEQTEQAPEYVTRADAERMVQDALNQARSYADKGRVKLQQKMQEVEAAIQTAERYGKPLTDEEKATLRQNAQAAALKDEPEDAAQPAGEPDPAMIEYASTELYAHDLKMQGKFGFELTGTDPEARTIKITGEREADRKAVEAAYQAKAGRLASGNQSNTIEATADNKAAVRAVPGVQGQRPAEIAQSANDYWSRVSDERRKRGQ